MRVLVAFTEEVRETIIGFEVCTLDETDAQHHPKLLGIAKTRADAMLFAAAPDLLAACEAALIHTPGAGAIRISAAKRQLIRAAIAKAKGR